jgi:hypothetical protein
LPPGQLRRLEKNFEKNRQSDVHPDAYFTISEIEAFLPDHPSKQQLASEFRWWHVAMRRGWFLFP